MKTISKYVQHGAALGGAVARDPGQFSYLARWSRSMRQSTMSAELPWLPYRVIDRLEGHLDRSSRVFEFGGGGSTLWFAKRVGQVVTVEHDPDWFPHLEAAVGDRPDCTLLHRTAQHDYSDYVTAIADFPDDSFDVVVVDGRERVRCFTEALPKVKPGGLLILDDTERPRYAAAFSLAADWPSKTYRGLTPTKNLPGVTTVWRRPVAG